MKKLSIIVVVITLFLAVLACESSGGTSGSVSGSSQSCYTQTNSGNCEGSFKKLKGTYTLEVENEHIYSGSVQVSLTASVQEGAVRVYVVDDSQNQASVDIQPGQTQSLSGLAPITMNAFKVYFEAMDGEAGGIAYHIDYIKP